MSSKAQEESAGLKLTGLKFLKITICFLARDRHNFLPPVHSNAVSRVIFLTCCSDCLHHSPLWVPSLATIFNLFFSSCLHFRSSSEFCPFPCLCPFVFYHPTNSRFDHLFISCSHTVPLNPLMKVEHVSLSLPLSLNNLQNYFSLYAPSQVLSLLLP